MRQEKPLYDVPLGWDHCVDLSERLRGGDHMECLSMGHTPLQALSSGIMGGKAIAALRRGSNACVGAFGWTYCGTIWSLWADDMTPREKLQVLRETPDWVRGFVQESGRDYLWNYIALKNPTGRAWLSASKCFWTEEDPRLVVSGEPFFYFQTLPHLANQARVA